MWQRNFIKSGSRVELTKNQRGTGYALKKGLKGLVVFIPNPKSSFAVVQFDGHETPFVVYRYDLKLLK